MLKRWTSFVLITSLVLGMILTNSNIVVYAEETNPLSEETSITRSFGTLYSFKDLEVTDATLDTRYMSPTEIGVPDVGALLFRNSEGPGHHMTIAFEVDKANEYKIDLQAYKASSYGIYDIKIDGESIGQYNFYASANGPGEFKTLATMYLSDGTHHITFESVGKDDASSNYFVSFMQLMLLNEEDREAWHQQVMDKIHEAQHVLEVISDEIPSGNTVEDQTLQNRSFELVGQLQSLEERGEQSSDPSTFRKLMAETENINRKIERLAIFVEARNARPNSPFGLVTADAMDLVYPRDLPCQCATGSAELSLAQGEFESIQAVIMPYGEDLHMVGAEITNIVGPDGEEVTESMLRASIDPLGSVYVKNAASQTLGYEGWIPDPIRSDLTNVDVPAGDMQPYWIEFYAGRQANPGNYQVTVTFNVEEMMSQTLEIDVNVWPFSIPDRPELATSISTKSTSPFAQPMFSERWFILEELYGITDQDKFDQIKDQYIDFLETFKIEPDLIYSTTPPTVEELLEIKNEWGLRQFNILYLPPYSMDFDLDQPDTWQPKIDSILQTIEAAMKEYEQAGLAKHAYIYGFDESREEQLPLAKELFGQIKERFPDLPIMTTFIDRSLGAETGLADLVDIWVPGVETINHEARIRAQDRGDQVYWYTHQAVRDPLPNWFNGYAPSDTRVLLGPMSHKMDVDGFLYYNIMRWTNHGPMDDGILTGWDPLTYPTANGDGSLFYPGAEGPLASQRIHNFRDGMEDYNLLNKLEDYIIKAEGVPDSLLEEAQKLLNADAVVTSESEYTQDADLYRQWREDVAEMIIKLETPKNVDDILQLIERIEDDGVFENDQAVHALKLHLIAVGRFEQQEVAKKVIKHMEGFKLLLDHQVENDLISKEAYNYLRVDADALIKQWR